MFKRSIALAVSVIVLPAIAQQQLQYQPNYQQQPYQPRQQYTQQAPQTSYSQQAGDFARVLSSRPLTESIPRTVQQCQYETISPQTQSNVAPLVGGVVGAIIGNQVGRGNGKQAATVLGAIGGSMVANDQYNAPQQVQRCVPQTTYETITRGYEVTFEYGGQTYVQQMPYNPGNQVRVHIRAE